MVGVFSEVRRVLRGDGTIWVNMGDSYCSQPNQRVQKPGGRDDVAGYKQATNHGSLTQGSSYVPGLKPKDLVGVPWMLAFALRADGWYLRQDIIWAKPNPMPESVTDRCTKSHEYIFLLSKSARYYYNQEAIAEPSATDDIRRPYTSEGAWQLDGRPAEQRHGGKPRYKTPDGWDTSEGNGGHGSFHREGREDGITDYQPKGKTGKNAFRGQGANRDSETGPANRDGREMRDVGAGFTRNKRSVWTIPTAPFPEAHFATFPEDLIKPCILAGCPAGGTVLDPFGGSGTTALVARANGCKAILIELNLEYIKISERRLAQEHLDFSGGDKRRPRF